MSSWYQLVLAAILATSAVGAVELVVETTHGRIRGASNGVARSFRGVPYAAPPLGLLRWAPPQPPPSWHPEIRNALADAGGCPQINCGHLTPPIACPKTTSEDCLYLNIFAPLNSNNASNLPVMVYIHGGNFFYMSGSSPLYNGEVFVQRGNVVLVNVDYRLGALGFLVTGDKETDATGNYGLYDQIQALKWVKDNIRQFGGDPDKVTLFGQSAGAQSVLQLMASDESSSYFTKVIVESSPITLPYKTFTEAYVLGGLLAEKLGCHVADIKCLRSKPANDVALAAFNTRAELASIKYLEAFEPYGPYVDGNFVKGQPLDVYSQSQYTKKPMMIGTNTEETVLYIYSAFNKSVSILEYSELIAALRPSKILDVLDQYPPDPTSGDQREVLVKVSTDLLFTCPKRNVTRLMLSQGASSIWVYEWNHAFSFKGWGPITFCEGRVCHGSEIVYVFGTAYEGNFTFTADETVLSDDTMTYWTNFAWSGDPNSSGDKFARMDKEQLMMKHRQKLQKVHYMSSAQGEEARLYEKMAAPMHWPQYSSTSGWSALEFQTPKSQVIQNYRSQECQFWDDIGYLG